MGIEEGGSLVPDVHFVINSFLFFFFFSHRIINSLMLNEADFFYFLFFILYKDNGSRGRWVQSNLCYHLNSKLL